MYILDKYAELKCLNVNQIIVQSVDNNEFIASSKAFGIKCSRNVMYYVDLLTAFAALFFLRVPYSQSVNTKISKLDEMVSLRRRLKCNENLDIANYIYYLIMEIIGWKIYHFILISSSFISFAAKKKRIEKVFKLFSFSSVHIV